MTPRERAGLIALLIVMGAGWGITQPLAKIAVSEGYRHFGLIFWQLVIGAVLLGGITLARGRRLPMQARHLRLYLVIALVGTIFPNTASFEAARHLPSGILSITLSLVPMFAFPIALSLGLDRVSFRRIAGLGLGLISVLLLIGPEASLPDQAMVAWIPLALIAPFFYGLEGNVVARWGTEGLDPVQVLFGASIIGALIALPLALGTGHFIDPRGPWGAPDAAMVASSVIHAVVYSSYVWMVGRAGSVFAAQVAYLVTGFGVVWAILLLQESYTPYVWASLVLMFAGISLVNPRRTGTLAPMAATGHSDSRT